MKLLFILKYCTEADLPIRNSNEWLEKGDETLEYPGDIWSLTDKRSEESGSQSIENSEEACSKETSPEKSSEVSGSSVETSEPGGSSSKESSGKNDLLMDSGEAGSNESQEKDVLLEPGENSEDSGSMENPEESSGESGENPEEHDIKLIVPGIKEQIEEVFLINVIIAFFW